MARKAKTYKKLPGRWFSPFVGRSLWQGPDHLLWVEGSMMHERYKRFFYKDIQALIMCRSNRRNIWTIFWGALILLFGIIALMVSGTPYVSASFSAIWAFLLAVNLLKGPSCDVYLQTAVQFEKLSSLVRIPMARKTLDGIKQLVQLAQGPLDTSTLAAAATALTLIDEVGPMPFSVAGRPAVPSETKIEPYRPWLHWVLFGLLTSMGLLRCAQLSLKWMLLSAVDMIGLACTVALVIVAIVRWHRQVKGSLVASVGWLTLILAGLHCMAAYAFFIAATLQNPDMAYNYWVTFKAFLELQTENYAVVKAYTVGFGAAGMVLGILGLFGMTLLGNRMPARSSVQLPGKTT